MKTRIINSLLLLVAVLMGNIHQAAAENVGNGNGDLVLKKILETNDGLTPEEKIYQMWVEAEGAVPDINSSQILGEWYGLNMVNRAENGEAVYDSGFKKWTYEKARETLLFLDKVDGLKAGPITVKPDTVYGYAVTMGNFDGHPETTYEGTIGEGIYLRTPEYVGRVEVSGSSSDYKAYPVKLTTTGMILTSVIPSFEQYKTEYRQISPDILVAVRKAIKATDEYGPCPGAKKVTKTESRLVEEPFKNILGKTKTRKVQKNVPVVIWELDQSFAVPGVCEVQLIYKKLK